MSIMGRTKGGAVKLYQITYLFGFFFGCILHLSVNKMFPPPGIGINEPFDGTVEGIEPSDDGTESPSKDLVTTDQKVIGEDVKI